MKITVFIEDFGATGVVRNAIAIAARLSEVGHRVTLLAALPEGVLRESVPPSVPTVVLREVGHTGERRNVMRRSLRQFRAYLNRETPDIVLSAGNHGHLLVLATTRLLPCRTIIRVSNDLVHQTNERQTGAWARWKRRLKFKAILKLADRVVLVSPSLLDQVRALDPQLASKAVVIPNGVDIGLVQAGAAEPVRDGLLGPKPVVLAIGRLAPQKNYGTLLEALAIARRSADVRLLIVGKGPLRSEMTETAERLGIEDSVRVIDPVENPFPLMKNAALMVLPSWWEGSSNVLLEALACGTPVVASRTAGNAAEILDGNRYGLLVDPGDPGQLANAILRQLGPDRVLPGHRAKDYDRSIALDAYTDLIRGMGQT